MFKSFLSAILIFSFSSFSYADDLSSGAMALLLSQSDSVTVVDESGADLGSLSNMLLELVKDLAQNIEMSNRCAPPESLEQVECFFSVSYSHLFLGDHKYEISYIVQLKNGISVSVGPTATLINGGSQ